MARTESVELTVLCLICNGDRYLLQDRIKADWRGLTLPGGHVEANESVVDAVIREMKEETGLTILNPKLCGIKQFPIEGGRYLVFLFKADEFSGNLISSDEGQMLWVHKDEISSKNAVADFNELIEVMLNDELTEFQYVLEDDKWRAVLK